MTTIGYIGLGNAGFSLASNLPKADYNLIVHDADPERVKKATEWKNTKAYDGTFDCEIIITMLPNGKIVKEVLDGIELKSGTIVIDTSSSSPFDTIKLGEELEKKGIHLVDSPITQTFMYATDRGESTMMVGCNDDLFQKVEPVLKHMARYIFHMGQLGSGHAMKTLNNYIMASSIIALNDSLITGQKFGLDPKKMIDVLNVGTGVNFPTLDTFRRDGLTRRFNSGFGLALLVKDIGITKEFMDHNKFETDLPDLIHKYLKYSLDQVDSRADHTEALKG